MYRLLVQFFVRLPSNYVHIQFLLVNPIFLVNERKTVDSTYLFTKGTFNWAWNDEHVLFSPLYFFIREIGLLVGLIDAKRQKIMMMVTEFCVCAVLSVCSVMEWNTTRFSFSLKQAAKSKSRIIKWHDTLLISRAIPCSILSALSPLYPIPFPHFDTSSGLTFPKILVISSLVNWRK